MRFLTANGLEFYREGHKHAIYIRRSDEKTVAVPRHREVQANTIRKMCKELGIDPPLER